MVPAGLFKIMMRAHCITILEIELYEISATRSIKVRGDFINHATTVMLVPPSY